LKESPSRKRSSNRKKKKEGALLSKEAVYLPAAPCVVPSMNILGRNQLPAAEYILQWQGNVRMEEKGKRKKKGGGKSAEKPCASFRRKKVGGN